MKKSILIYGLIVVVLIVGVYFSATSFSTIGTDNQDYQCRIVMKGDVCSSYNDCQFLSDRGVSCIKGYEIITFPDDLPDTQQILVPVVTQGGESK